MLTPKQRILHDYCASHAALYGFIPTHAEMGQHLGITKEAAHALFHRMIVRVLSSRREYFRLDRPEWSGRGRMPWPKLRKIPPHVVAREGVN